MKAKNIICVWLKAFTCLSFALALVFSAPSASHAATGMHDGGHAAITTSVDTVDSHARHEISSTTHYKVPVITSKSDDEKQSSGECCNGICISVALTEADTVFVEQSTVEVYLMLYAQTNSIESSGFLRPPQILI